MSELGKSRQEQIAGGELAPRVVSLSTSRTLAYRSIVVESLKILYREAGPPNAPILLLLHGYPSSSRMFDSLLPLFADSYRLIAPDYPGFGQSASAPADEFVYSFDHLGEVVLRFTDVLGLLKYTPLMQDSGGPIGFRLALAHPERVEALIVQNTVASEDGLGPAWEIRKAYWKNREAYEGKVIPEFVSVESFKRRHIGSCKRPERYNPDSWLDEHAQVSQPVRSKIQADLFWTYQTNVALYPVWQDPGALGQVRSFVHYCRRPRIPKRNTGRRSAHSRCRSFRIRRMPRRECLSDPGFSQAPFGLWSASSAGRQPPTNF